MTPQQKAYGRYVSNRAEKGLFEVDGLEIWQAAIEWFKGEYHEGLQCEVNELLQIALTNPDGLMGFIKMNYPTEFAAMEGIEND